MAPKKSSKGKVGVAEPTHAEGWVSSKCSESDLETLVFAGLLPEKSVAEPPKTTGPGCTDLCY